MISTDRTVPLAWLPPLAVMAMVWSLLPGLLPLFQLPAESWGWAFAWQGVRFGVEGVRTAPMIGAMFTGFFFQTWFAIARPRAFRLLGLGIYAALAIAYLGLALLQNLAASLTGSSDVLSGSLLGLAVGCVAGAFEVRRFTALLPNVQSALRVWSWLVAAPFVLAVLPVAGDASLAHIGFSAFADLPQRFYQLIKALIVWLPVGLIFALAGQGRALRVWGIAGLATVLLVLNVSLLNLQWRDLMNLLAALPGLAGGICLVERGGFVPQTASAAVENPAAESNVMNAEHAQLRRESSLTSRPAEQERDVPAAVTVTRKFHQPTPLAIASSLLILSVVLIVLADFPYLPVLLGVSLTLYAAYLWRQPLAWLLVVPAALPVLDLAPWSGRFFLDEFDMLMAVTLALSMLRGRPLHALAWPPLSQFFIAVFFGLALISGLIGLSDLPAIDANAFSTYWSPYNALRVAKGLAWAGVFLFLARRSCDDHARFTRWLAIGMALGLLAVCLVGVWERWLYSGLADRDTSYRIVGLFSSMHTGGGHIEAYMAASLPFLWLGMRHWKTLLLTAPLMALATYVLIYTVARGGALAFGLIFLILAIGSARLAWLAGNRRIQLAPLLALFGAGAILIVGISGGYFQQRFSQTGEDTQTRLDHWSRTLAMADDSWTASLFGMGLGSFPRVFLARGVPEDRPATYGFVASRTGQALRLGSGATLYYAQRVPIEAGTVYRLVLDVRAEGSPVRLETPLCEKQMLNSRRCVWSNIDVPGDGVWRRVERSIDSGEVGAGSALSHLPTEFVLSHAGKAGLLEIDNVRLFDATGRDLLCNGNFEAGADCWFFKTHSHLPWHIKNVWVHVAFEQGWLGLAAFMALTGLALARAGKAAWRGQPLAWVLFASLVGLLSVGLFDSLLDAPRLALLLLGFSLLAVAPPWAARRTVRKKSRRRTHRQREAAA